MAQISAQTMSGYLQELWDIKGTDLLITAGAPPLMRVDEQLRPISGEPVLRPSDTEKLVLSLLAQPQAADLAERKELDFSFSWQNRARFRGNAFHQRDSVALSLRLIPFDIPTLEELGAPPVVSSLIDQPSELDLPCYPTDEALRQTRACIERFNGRLDGRVRAWAMPFSLETCTPELIRGAKQLADELGTGLTLHHSGGQPAGGGPRPTERLAELGALGPNVLLAHVAGIDLAEAELIAQSSTSVAICPSTTQKEGSGLGSRLLPELLERGVAVALGSDSANSSNYLDMVRAMNAAAAGFKDARRDVHLVPAEQALEMATLFGARALGLDGEIGSIEVGKQADLVVFDTRRAEWRALFDPVNNLVYSADGRSVRTVIAGGRVVVDGGRATFVDEAALSERVQQHGQALLERTGSRINRGRWPIV